MEIALNLCYFGALFIYLFCPCAYPNLLGTCGFVVVVFILSFVADY
jgi:hypothetical protein